MEPKRKATTLSPPAAAASAAVIAMVLGNYDILRQILLCLGLPTSLVRAAAVCKDWYQIASDPDFLRRFRALHPPRLLGLYDSARLRFVPRPHPPELAAFVRRFGSFKFHLARGEKVNTMFDCRNGRLLVSASGIIDDEPSFGYAMCSALHPERGLARIPYPDFPDDESESEDDDGNDSGDDDDSLDDNSIPWYVLDRGLLLPEHGGDALACTSVSLMHCGSMGIWVYVCDFENGAWSEGRRSALIRREDLPENLMACRKFGVLAHGKVYRICMEHHILVLDLASTSLFILKLPEGVAYDEADANLGLCRAEGSGIFLIHVKGLQLFVWTHSFDSTSSDNWKLVDIICLRQAFGQLAHPTWLSGHFVFYVHEVGDNAEFMFLEIEQQMFCMNVSTREVEKVYDEETQNNGCPYDVLPMMMVWPPTFPEMKTIA